MTRVLFIHGTMTRYDERYKATTTQIWSRLQAHSPAITFDFLPWGELWGAKLNPRGVTIPGYDERAGPDVLGGEVSAAPGEPESAAIL